MGKELGKSTDPSRRGVNYTQTELRVHEEWAHFTLRHPPASALVHKLCALAGEDDTVVCSQRAIAEMLRISQATVSRAIKAAEEAGYIEVLKLGATLRGACAYRLNSRVHWTKARTGHEFFTSFRARVVALGSDQETKPEELASQGGKKLRKVPVIMPGEVPVPVGPGMEPPSQPDIEGLPPVAIERDPNTLDIFGGES